jgi:hypothetical protein
VNFGSVMPFFCRHSRSAEKRLRAPAAPPVVDVAALALVPAVVVEPVEELPHAASRRLASARRRTAVAVGVRLRLLLVI